MPLLSGPVQQLATYAGQRHVPLLIHPSPRRAAMLDELTRTHPDTTFIVPHLDEDAVDVSARRDNVLLDTAGLKHDAAAPEAGAPAGCASKVIFGSNAPREAGGDLGYSLRLLERARLSASDMERVCWGS
jgi:predicted TIM-barrel fold metal-dependent hydrolase